MKEMLGNYADGQIEFYKAVGIMLRVLRANIAQLLVRRPWKNGTVSYPSSNVYEWTFNLTDSGSCYAVVVLLVCTLVYTLLSSSPQLSTASRWQQ